MHAFEELRLAASRRMVALHGQPGSLEALHVAGLWAIAVVQPLFDLLGSNPEFLVAHNTRPTDLPGLLIALCLAGPACCLLGTRLCHRLGPGWHSLATGIVTGTLVATVALATIRLEADWSLDASFGVAAACGVLAAGGYVWVSTVRLFATFLSPAAIIVPAVFLLNPAISPFLSKSGSVHAIVDGVTFDETPPVIVVVFDQLPLASLLNRAGEIDRTLYPHFAALADDTTWFRNASAVTEATTLALPAIVTGNYPTPGRVPVAADHPANLFTLFGARYRLQVLEPLTDLCPATLCAPDRMGAIAWLVPVLSDLAVVFLHQVLPAAATMSLPPVTQNWRDFAAPDTFLDRWNLRWDSLRVRGRRATAAAFIDALSAEGQPTLHFAHLLLPHEPWHFLRTGQRFSAHRFSLAGPRNGIWPDDERAVAVNYQRHLLQVQYVDSLVGALAARLREAGIWDDALVVVTSDHGLSLRPGLPFLQPTANSFADIAAVPLFVKRPGQRRGEVVDANVEVIDILPTLAAEVGVELPWETDGVNVFAPGVADRTGKVMFVENEQKRVNGPGYLHDALMETVARKFAIFPGGNPLNQPRLKRYDDLIGTPTVGIRGQRPANLDVTMDAPYLLNDVEHSADFVPAHLTGRVVLPEDGSATPLAVAINGVVAAVTLPYAFKASGRRARWETIVDPRLLRPGANSVGVFAVRERRDGAFELEEAYRSNTGSPETTGVNLIPEETAERLGVTVSGFHLTEPLGDREGRWTDGRGRLSVPIDPRAAPAAMAVSILMTDGRRKRLEVAVNGCPLFDGTVRGSWAQTFALDACILTDSPTIEIDLLSDRHRPATIDERTLGVAVGSIELRGGADRQQR